MRKYLAYALVARALVGGTVAFMSMEKPRPAVACTTPQC
jgi:hypothetical protein